MTPPKANESERLMANVPLSTTSPVIEPLAPPLLPSCRVPPVMVVPPV